MRGEIVGNVLPFARRESGVDRHLVETAAAQAIELLGSAAGYEVGMLARLQRLPQQDRENLLAVEQEIAHRQGYEWHFPDAAP